MIRNQSVTIQLLVWVFGFGILGSTKKRDYDDYD